MSVILQAINHLGQIDILHIVTLNVLTMKDGGFCLGYNKMKESRITNPHFNILSTINDRSFIEGRC